jgi:hypothetical protein
MSYKLLYPYYSPLLYYLISHFFSSVFKRVCRITFRLYMTFWPAYIAMRSIAAGQNVAEKNRTKAARPTAVFRSPRALLRPKHIQTCYVPFFPARLPWTANGHFVFMFSSLFLLHYFFQIVS